MWVNAFTPHILLIIFVDNKIDRFSEMFQGTCRENIDYIWNLWFVEQICSINEILWKQYPSLLFQWYCDIVVSSVLQYSLLIEKYQHILRLFALVLNYT
jgi:hypothetical protein